MADRIEAFRVTVPRGTRASKPVSGSLRFTEGIVVAVEIVVPDGPCGFSGLRLTEAKQPLIPITVGQWIITNNEIIHWPLANQIESGDWGYQAYNEDVYAHSYYIRFQVVEPERGSVAAPAPSFGPGAPVGAGQIEAGGGGGGGEGEGEAAPGPEPAPEGQPVPEGEPAPAPEPPAEGPPAGEAPPAPEPPPEAEAPPAPEAEAPEAPEGGGEAPPERVPKPVPGETVAQRIANFEREIPRLEREARSLEKQIKVHPGSPAVPGWRLILKGVKDSIAHMRRELPELRRMPPDAEAPTHHYKGPKHQLSEKAAEKFVVTPAELAHRPHSKSRPKEKPREGVGGGRPAPPRQPPKRPEHKRKHK